MHSHIRRSVPAFVALALLTAAGCGDDDPTEADASATTSPTTVPVAPESTSTPSVAVTPPDHTQTNSDKIVEAIVLATTEVPARLSGLTASEGALWAAADGGTVVRITGERVDEVSVDGVEGALRPIFTDGESWWAEVGGSKVVHIDPDSLAIDTPIEVGSPVGGIVEGPDGSLWIEATQPPAGLRPFDPSTGEAGDVVVLAESDEVVGTVSAAGSLWAPVFGGNQILRLDPNLEIVDTVPTGVGPATARTVGDAVWWVNRIDGTLGRLDTRSGETATVDLNQSTPVEMPSPIVSTATDVWVVAATIEDRTGIIFRVDATSGEVIAARSLPAGRSVDELGGLAALDDRLFLLLSTSGELIELDINDFTTVADPDRPAPTTEPMSEDETAIRAVMETLFSSSTPPADAVALLEDGDELDNVFGSFRQFFTDNFGDQAVAAEVFGVRVDDDTAEADYVVTVSGGPIVDTQTATLIHDDHRWHVTRTSFCELVSLGEIQCP